MSIQEHDAPGVETNVLDDEVVPTSRKGALIGFTAVVTIALVLLGFALWPRYQTATAQVSGQRLSADPTGQSAPDFTAVRLSDGSTMKLSDLRGKTVVLNFWASWCTTCQDEAAVIAAAEKKWRAKGVVFLGVDSHDTNAGAATYQRKYGIEFDSAIDSDVAIGAQYDVTGLPETFFLDKQGTIVQKYISAVDAATIDQLIGQTVAAG
jgi:cytochrome c biogenesis protein CcmG/thiol:disulfide interchange protein DsbE